MRRRKQRRTGAFTGQSTAQQRCKLALRVPRTACATGQQRRATTVNSGHSLHVHWQRVPSNRATAAAACAAEQAQQLEDDNLSVGELLLIRRQAEYLQVQGCAEACDAALEECFNRSTVSSGSSSSSTASPLAPVLELYNLRHLLPTKEAEPRVKPLLTACHTCLVRHWEVQLPESPEGTPRATIVQILVWLLGGGDVRRNANNLELRHRWSLLTPAALEELLQSDHVRTDDEATVVLLVEMWVAAQGSAVTEADKARVRRQLRLVNCSTCYLFDVLPKLPWLGPNPGQQAAFLARCRLTDRSQWRQHAGVLGGYDTSSPWYGDPRPQSVPERGVSYVWEVTREDVLAGLRKEGGDVMRLMATFRGGRTHCGDNSRIVALGFKWAVSIDFKQGDARAGLFVICHVPSAIEAQAGRLRGECTVSVRLGLCGEGAAGQAGRLTLRDHMVPFGLGLGLATVLPLEQGAGGQVAGDGQQQHWGEQGAGGGAKTDEELLVPWAKLLGLTFARPTA